MATVLDDTHLARATYLAYGHRTDFKNYRGEPMPLFDDLGDTIQDAWRCAARAAIVAALTQADVESLRRWVDEE